MADMVGIAAAGPGDRGADLVRGVVSDGGALTDGRCGLQGVRVPAAAQVPLEQGGTPARPASAGQEAS